MEAQNLLNYAIQEIQNLKEGEVFIVKDLFKGYLWNRETITNRLTTGTLFLNYAKQNPEFIEILEKNSSNQQKYKIISNKQG